MNRGNTAARVAAEDAALDILNAAGDDWPDAARRHRFTIQAEGDEHRRDRVTVTGHVLYRDDQTGRWLRVITAADLAHRIRTVRLSR